MNRCSLTLRCGAITAGKITAKLGLEFELDEDTGHYVYENDAANNHGFFTELQEIARLDDTVAFWTRTGPGVDFVAAVGAAHGGELTDTPCDADGKPLVYQDTRSRAIEIAEYGLRLKCAKHQADDEAGFCERGDHYSDPDSIRDINGALTCSTCCEGI